MQHQDLGTDVAWLRLDDDTMIVVYMMCPTTTIVSTTIDWILLDCIVCTLCPIQSCNHIHAATKVDYGGLSKNRVPQGPKSHQKPMVEKIIISPHQNAFVKLGGSFLGRFLPHFCEQILNSSSMVHPHAGRGLIVHEMCQGQISECLWEEVEEFHVLGE